MQISKEYVEKWVGGRGRWQAFSLNEAGAYIKDGQTTLYYHFMGKGADKNVFDKTYDAIVSFTDELNAFAKGQNDKAQTVDAIMAKLSELK